MDDMLLSVASRRDRAAADADAAERLRSVRERLEAAVSGLGELDYLRQRQEVLVRSALELREEQQEQEVEEERRREARVRSEEKVLEENILLLRKQLNCLRRRDAGLITQLQELDRQISDLRLDTEASHDPLEIDSRPSSGFFDLSDGASVSLSNSSNSVFSECFCPTADADGRILSADELAGCLECDSLVGGLCDDLPSSGPIRRSLSAPYPPALDSVHQRDVVTRNSGDTYRYPSPLHAVAVQSSTHLQMSIPVHQSRDEGVEGLKAESSPPLASAPPVPQSFSWPPCSSSQRRLDSYIFSLVQRRAPLVRTSRPRTSISTEPSKSILRQASLSLRPGPGPSSGSVLGTLRVSEVRPSWPPGGAATEGGATSSPLRLQTEDGQPEEQQSQKVVPDDSMDFKMNKADNLQSHSSSPPMNAVQDGGTNGFLKKKRLLPPSVSTATVPRNLKEPESPKANSSPRDTQPPCFPVYQPASVKPPQSAPANSHLNPPQSASAENDDRTVQDVNGLGSSSQSQEGAGGPRSQMTNCSSIQRQNAKPCEEGIVRMVNLKASRTSEHNKLLLDRKGDKQQHRSGSKQSRLSEDGALHTRGSRRAAGGRGSVHRVSSRKKRHPASIQEGRVLDKHSKSTSSVHSGTARHHHHGNHHRSHHHHPRDQVVVVAKPKHKRNDYRRLHAIVEAPYDDAFRHAQRQQHKELIGHSVGRYRPLQGQLSSPYTNLTGSDSEYSAECASLFHSTIVETSEDERSNYTTNCFGDSESGEERLDDSTPSSEAEETGGGGAGINDMGRGWSQCGAGGSRAIKQQMTAAQTKAVIKIKASHQLKKKILRFRSGSLKLMTTV